MKNSPKKAVVLKKCPNFENSKDRLNQRASDSVKKNEPKKDSSHRESKRHHKKDSKNRRLDADGGAAACLRRANSAVFALEPGSSVPLYKRHYVEGRHAGVG